LHRGYAAAHGDKCFTEVVVATSADGKILAAMVDDYQYMASSSAGITPVPNTDGMKDNVVADTVLMDKYSNSAVYSDAMKTKGGATQEWAKSMDAITAYAKGKTASEISSVTGVDAVSGATLADTVNYLKAIATVAQSNDLTTTGTYTGNGSDLKIGHVLYAAHGTKAFASAVSIVQGSTVVAASIDDFQYVAKDTAGITAVPNSDGGFGQSYANNMVLMSKSVNSKVYSEGMKTKGGATQEWLTSMQAIEKFVAGKSLTDLTSVSGVDAVSGATLADTVGYVTAAHHAAEAAK
jgi:cytochrome c2